jgi:hypothetical protein
MLKNQQREQDTWILKLLFYNSGWNNDPIRLKQITTADNYMNMQTKATRRTLFYRHMNYILGCIPPTHVTIKSNPLQKNDSKHNKIKKLTCLGSRQGIIKTPSNPG